MSVRLFIGDKCPECQKLKPYVPEGIEVIDTSTAEGMAEAAFDCVYAIPTVICNGKRHQGYWACRKFFEGVA